MRFSRVRRGDGVLEGLAGGEAFEFADGEFAEAGDLVADGTGDVRGDEDVRQVEQRRVRRQRLRIGHIEDGVDPPGHTFTFERGRVDDLAAGGVDQHRAVP